MIWYGYKIRENHLDYGIILQEMNDDADVCHCWCLNRKET
jgi:hypothetical protein